MRFISGRPETREETVAVIERVKQRWTEFGYSWWSFIDKESGLIIGAGALQNLRREATAHPDLACPLEVLTFPINQSHLTWALYIQM